MATLLNDHQKAEEIRFILNDGQWPLWPVLPIKRRPEVEGEDNEAIILASDQMTIYFVLVPNLKTGNLKEQLADKRTEKFASIEALIDAGWLVD